MSTDQKIEASSLLVSTNIQNSNIDRVPISNLKTNPYLGYQSEDKVCAYLTLFAS